MDVFDALTPLAASRLRASVVSPFAQAYWDRLCDQGYAPSTVRLYLNCLAHFAHWATRQRFELAALERHVNRFVEQHLPRCRCIAPVQRKPQSVRSALEHFKTVTVDAGVRLDAKTRSPGDEQLQRFDRHLLQMKGLTASTRRRRLAIVRPLASTVSDAGVPTPDQLRQFLRRELARQRCQCRRHDDGRAQLSSLPCVRRRLRRTSAADRRLSRKLALGTTAPDPHAVRGRTLARRLPTGPSLAPALLRDRAMPGRSGSSQQRGDRPGARRRRLDGRHRSHLQGQVTASRHPSVAADYRAPSPSTSVRSDRRPQAGGSSCGIWHRWRCRLAPASFGGPFARPIGAPACRTRACTSFVTRWRGGYSTPAARSRRSPILETP